MLGEVEDVTSSRVPRGGATVGLEDMQRGTLSALPRDLIVALRPPRRSDPLDARRGEGADVLEDDVGLAGTCAGTPRRPGSSGLRLAASTVVIIARPRAARAVCAAAAER